MMNKQSYSRTGLGIASVMLSFLNSPLFPIPFDDKEIFRYIGMVMNKGGVPYRDVFDHKPPLIYFLNTWGVWAGPWAFWLVDCLLVLLASILFYQTCKRYKLVWPWLLPLLFNLLLRQSVVSFGIGMTREYTAIFLLLFFCLLLSEIKYRYYWMGLLTGLTFFMQQDALLPLLPFLAYALFIGPTTPAAWPHQQAPPTAPLPLNTQPHQQASLPNNRLLHQVLPLALGFLIIAIPIITYFALHHSLSLFWEDAFAFNGRLARDRGSLAANCKILKTALHAGEYDGAFYTAIVLGIASLAGRHQKKGLGIMALCAVALSFASEFLSGRLLDTMAFIYYLLPLAATLPILVFVAFAWSDEAYIRDSKAQLVFGAILSIQLLLGSLRTISALSMPGHQQGIAANAPFGLAAPELAYLEKQSLQDYQLYVFYESNLVYAYNRLGIRSPSKWIYHYFWTWYRDWDRDGSVLSSIIQDLRSHRTTYILDASDRAPGFRQNQAYASWKSFLDSAYTPIVTDSSRFILWKIR